MEVFNKLLETIENSAINNKATIENVELFVKSWKREAESLQLRKTGVSNCNLENLKKGDIIEIIYGDKVVKAKVIHNYPPKRKIRIRIYLGHFLFSTYEKVCRYDSYHFELL